MTEPFTFSVVGTPRPQPRPRRVHGRFVSTVCPKARLWRSAIERALSDLIVPRFDCPLRVTLAFRFATPRRERHGNPHDVRPDADNLAKAVMDVMEAAGVMLNDKLVVELVVSKTWAPDPGMVALVEPVDVGEATPLASPPLSKPDWL